MNIQQKIEKIREILVQRNCIEPDIKHPRSNGSFLIKSSIINLEVLLVALNKNIIEKDEGLFFSNGSEVRKILVDEAYSRTICHWQPSKILEHQSEETIDAIYNIFF